LNLAQNWDAIRAQVELEVEAAKIVQSPAEEVLDDEMLDEPPSPTSVLEIERRGIEDSAKFIDVSLGSLPPSTLLSHSNSSKLPNIDEEPEDKEEKIEAPPSRRKKSILKLKQLTGLMLGIDVDAEKEELPSPSSPLKQEFSVPDFESDMVLDQVLEMKTKDKGHGKGVADKRTKEGEIDIQMEELMRARSDLLRRLEKGEVGEFGDEGF